MTTIADIARKANVSVSTVSYAISGTRPISEETRQRIFSVMEEMGYQPNAMARGLASKKSRIIALLFPDVGIGLGVVALGFFFNTAEVAKRNGYNLILWPSMFHAADLREQLKQGLVDGVIVMEVSLNDERIKVLQEMHFPFSMVGRTANPEGQSYVDIDSFQGVRDAVNYLISLGHTHIAFLNEARASQGHGPAIRSYEGYEHAMKAAGLTCVSRIAECEPAAGLEALNAMLDEDPKITALINKNEYASPGITQAIASRGWTIPDDFSVIIGPTSTQMAEFMIPNQTSIDIPIAEMSRIGVQLLVQQLEGQDTELTQVLIPCELTIRDSTAECRRKP